MRDDIHKSVPRPPAIQRWVRFNVNDADRLAGRGVGALEDAMGDTCRRELGPDFVRGLIKALTAPTQLFGTLDDAASPRDLGGRGGPTEWEVLTEAKRLSASGTRPEAVAQAAIAAVMKSRVEADIRVSAPSFRDTTKRRPSFSTV